jgi:hypothetical protein
MENLLAVQAKAIRSGFKISLKIEATWKEEKQLSLKNSKKKPYQISHPKEKKKYKKISKLFLFFL